MIAALKKDEALLEDIKAAEDGEDQFHLWWLGQSGFLLKWNGNYLLFDPYLSDSLTRKYESTDKPHVRMSEEVIDPASLDFVKVVTSSHNHTDHLDGETLSALAKAAGGITLILPEANIPFAKERLGDAEIEYLGMDDDTGKFLGPWEIEGIASAHNKVEKDERGRCRFMGFDVGFGAFNIYHSGDTLWHERLVPELCESSPDVAILPINGHDPARGVAGNLNGTEAAALGKAINARLVVPCHYHMFEFNTEDPDRFVATCERLGQRCQVLQGGERLTVRSS